jgi:hypothetical protein
MCTVNVPHNCVRNNCTSNGFQYVYQERKLTTQKRAVTMHDARPDDRVLNTAQMRDAPYLQQFRIPSATITPADEERILHDSVLATINARKRSAAQVAARGRGQAQGAGRGQGRGRGTVQRGRGRGTAVVEGLNEHPHETVFTFVAEGSLRGRGHGQGRGNNQVQQ